MATIILCIASNMCLKSMLYTFKLNSYIKYISIEKKRAILEVSIKEVKKNLKEGLKQEQESRLPRRGSHHLGYRRISRIWEALLMMKQV